MRNKIATFCFWGTALIGVHLYGSDKMFFRAKATSYGNEWFIMG